MEFQEILEKLCNARGISGDESEVASIIIKEIEEFCDCHVDNLGSVIAFKKGKKTPKKKIMLDAHMDEVGMMVTGFASDGSLIFDTVGGIDSRVMIGRQVLVGNDCLSGVIGGKPIHLQDAEERKAAVPQISCTSISAAPPRRRPRKWSPPAIRSASPGSSPPLVMAI